ncbi:uncharacterized protein TNCV_809611 [Trichonephila clavipes]|uniref:Uncharacterized protein n=1 Tax=Trichonephila clavipes TaxID=2585209 RepID=A0A8X6VI07_TRICX|nr:uncharacterized protein TNCV_809611 [Trichonephila clavipes]
MSIKSPFAIQKALIGIGGEPKSVKRLRSGDLLIETTSSLQTKSFLLTKSFLNSPLTVSPHKSLNSCRGVISEPDLLGNSDSEILEGFSDQGVTQTFNNIHSYPNRSQSIKHTLQCLTPISSKNPLPGTSSSVSTYSTSSSSTEDNLLPSPSETETHSHTTPAKLNSVSTENFPESVPNESNSEHSTAAEAQQIVKRKSRNRRKRPKIQKPDIEIKRVPHRSRNATPTEITTDDEDIITYYVEEEELEQDPFILPKGYLRALTPSRYRNYRD